MMRSLQTLNNSLFNPFYSDVSLLNASQRKRTRGKRKSFRGRLTVKEEEKGKETENDEESSDNSLFNPFHPDVSY